MAQPVQVIAPIVLASWCLIQAGCRCNEPAPTDGPGSSPVDGATPDSGPTNPSTEGGPLDAGGPEAAPPPQIPPELGPDHACDEAREIAIFISPRRPMVRKPFRVMVVSDEDLPGASLWGRTAAGEVIPLEQRHFRGPPYAWSTTVERPGRGRWYVALSTAGQVHSCEIVRLRALPPERQVLGSVWPVEAAWDHQYENLYSAFIMQLFAAPPDERPSWSPLHEVLRDRERNWLYNRLGLDEDSPDGEVRLEATPDCADMPYYLRAYFAWKMRLPFMFSSCTRGRGGAAPRCVRSFSNLDPPVDGLRAAGLLAAESATTDPGSAGTVTGGASDGGGPSLDAQLMELSQQDASITEPLAFNHFMNDMMTRTVQSGAGRTLPGNSNSDLYPLALRREAIRPGVIFVDPYGHLLVVSQWQEATATSPGVLFAVDGHPDLSIGRKRFWQGAFLFVDDMSWGAGGFKAFRPVIAEEEDGVIELRRLNNYEIRHHPDWGNFSTEQYQLGTEGFYRRMDRVVNPTPLPPDVAQRAILDAFFELVQERVDSVAAGETYMARRNYRPITMPEGGDIFETSGRWEDYSTPARDLRLLIAIDLVQGFPRRLTAHPEDFALPPGAEPAAVARQLGQSAAEFLRGHGVSYRRSNGEDQRLTLMQVIERQVDLEMAYNPNDCVEIRWAAPAGSTERGTCARHAPDEQRERMESYRTWFHTRIRPPRE